MAMNKTANRRFSYSRLAWEVFWVTDYVHHLQMKFGDGVHLDDIREVEDFVCKARYFPLPGKPHYRIGLAKHKGKYYQAIVLFEPRRRRCVVKTVYLVSDPNLLGLCKSNNL